MEVFMTVTQPNASVTMPQPGLVTFLLDRSWSMNEIKAATLEGFNGYLGGLQEEKDSAIDFTLITFDDVSIDRIHVAVPVKEARMLTEETYQPRGSTPLIEASIKTILAVEESLTKRTDKPRVVINIQTDGQENRSGPEYTIQSLRALVEKKQAEGWEFNFLGSGIDVYGVGAQYGFRRENTMSYDAKSLGATKNAFRATASNSASFASGRVASAAYSTEDRAASGDRFWGSNPPASPPPAAKSSRAKTAAKTKL
jgi:hypothetical protein